MSSSFCGSVSIFGHGFVQSNKPTIARDTSKKVMNNPNFELPSSHVPHYDVRLGGWKGITVPPGYSHESEHYVGK